MFPVLATAPSSPVLFALSLVLRSYPNSEHSKNALAARLFEIGKIVIPRRSSPYAALRQLFVFHEHSFAMSRLLADFAVCGLPPTPPLFVRNMLCKLIGRHQPA